MIYHKINKIIFFSCLFIFLSKPQPTEVDKMELDQPQTEKRYSMPRRPSAYKPYKGKLTFKQARLNSLKEEMVWLLNKTQKLFKLLQEQNIQTQEIEERFFNINKINRQNIIGSLKKITKQLHKIENIISTYMEIERLDKGDFEAMQEILAAQKSQLSSSSKRLRIIKTQLLIPIIQKQQEEASLQLVILEKLLTQIKDPTLQNKISLNENESSILENLQIQLPAELDWLQEEKEEAGKLLESLSLTKKNNEKFKQNLDYLFKTLKNQQKTLSEQETLLTNAQKEIGNRIQKFEKELKKTINEIDGKIKQIKAQHQTLIHMSFVDENIDFLSTEILEKQLGWLEEQKQLLINGEISPKYIDLNQIKTALSKQQEKLDEFKFSQEKQLVHLNIQNLLHKIKQLSKEFNNQNYLINQIPPDFLDENINILFTKIPKQLNGLKTQQEILNNAMENCNRNTLNITKLNTIITNVKQELSSQEESLTLHEYLLENLYTDPIILDQIDSLKKTLLTLKLSHLNFKEQLNIILKKIHLLNKMLIEFEKSIRPNESDKDKKTSLKNFEKKLSKLRTKAFILFNQTIQPVEQQTMANQAYHKKFYINEETATISESERLNKKPLVELTNQMLSFIISLAGNNPLENFIEYRWKTIVTTKDLEKITGEKFAEAIDVKGITKIIFSIFSESITDKKLYEEWAEKTKNFFIPIKKDNVNNITILKAITFFILYCLNDTQINIFVHLPIYVFDFLLNGEEKNLSGYKLDGSLIKWINYLKEDDPEGTYIQSFSKLLNSQITNKEKEKIIEEINGWYIFDEISTTITIEELKKIVIKIIINDILITEQRKEALIEMRKTFWNLSEKISLEKQLKQLKNINLENVTTENKILFFQIFLRLLQPKDLQRMFYPTISVENIKIAYSTQPGELKTSKSDMETIKKNVENFLKENKKNTKRLEQFVQFITGGRSSKDIKVVFNTQYNVKSPFMAHTCFDTLEIFLDKQEEQIRDYTTFKESLTVALDSMQ